MYVVETEFGSFCYEDISAAGLVVVRASAARRRLPLVRNEDTGSDVTTLAVEMALAGLEAIGRQRNPPAQLPLHLAPPYEMKTVRNVLARRSDWQADHDLGDKRRRAEWRELYEAARAYLASLEDA